MPETTLTREEKRLARHALGLGGVNTARRSYRNRYVAPWGSPADTAWAAMVGRGIAEIDCAGPAGRCYRLTRAGALAALNSRESLCPEDFPTKENADA